MKCQSFLTLPQKERKTVADGAFQGSECLSLFQVSSYNPEDTGPAWEPLTFTVLSYFFHVSFERLRFARIVKYHLQKAKVIVSESFVMSLTHTNKSFQMAHPSESSEVPTVMCVRIPTHPSTLEAQVGHEFKASLGYRANSKPAWSM